MGTLELFRRYVIHSLLEEDGAETGIEGTNTLILQDLAETANETICVCRLGDKSDTGSLERAQGNIGEELGQTGRGEVNTGPVVGSILNTNEVDRLLLEELVTAELQGALQEVSGECRAKTGQESTGTLVGDDLAEPADHTIVIRDGVELNSRLDAVVGMVLVMLLTPCTSVGNQSHADTVVTSTAVWK